MKRMMFLLVLLLLVAVFVSFAQETTVAVSTTTTIPATPTQSAVTDPVAKPVQVFPTDKVSVEFFLDNGEKMDSKGFTFYLLRVVGDKPTSGQVTIIAEAGVNSFLVQKDGLYILGAHSDEYGWLGEGNFFIKLSVKGYVYSSRGAKLFVDKNGNPQVFIKFEGFVPKLM